MGLTKAKALPTVNTQHEIRIDRQGRIVLPKVIRDALGLCEGSKLTFEMTPSVVELTPVATAQSRWENGLLILTGELDPSFDFDECTSDIRIRGLG